MQELRSYLLRKLFHIVSDASKHNDHATMLVMIPGLIPSSL